MVRTVWSLLAGIVLLGAGCAIAGEPRPAPTVGPLVEARCPRDGAGMVGPKRGDDPYAGTLPPDGFIPVSVVRCVDDLGRYDEDKGITVYTIDESTAAVSPALLTALALPDERRPGDVTCPMAIRSVLYLLLVNADGLAYHPQTPITPCREPRPEVEQALADLQWRFRPSFEVEQPG
jgi:hypothetical protein